MSVPAVDLDPVPKINSFLTGEGGEILLPLSPPIRTADKTYAHPSHTVPGYVWDNVAACWRRDSRKRKADDSENTKRQVIVLCSDEDEEEFSSDSDKKQQPSPRKKPHCQQQPPLVVNEKVQTPMIVVERDLSPIDDFEPTPGLIPMLQAVVGPSFLCCSCPTLQHIQQKDNWSCGFRNIQMMLTALVPLLHRDHPFFKLQCYRQSDELMLLPSLLDLQQGLEAAWREGWDPKGKEFYGGRIFGLTHKQAEIGAIEARTLLASWGIDSLVVQFLRTPKSRRLLGPFCAAYFSCETEHLMSQEAGQLVLGRVERSGARRSTEKASPVRLPLYLQWKGHSVTVVGVEFNSRKEVENLLLFDPRNHGESIRRTLSSSVPNLSTLRISCAELAKRDTQIILCTLNKHVGPKHVHNILTVPR